MYLVALVVLEDSVHTRNNDYLFVSSSNFVWIVSRFKQSFVRKAFVIVRVVVIHTGVVFARRNYRLRPNGLLTVSISVTRGEKRFRRLDRNVRVCRREERKVSWLGNYYNYYKRRRFILFVHYPRVREKNDTKNFRFLVTFFERRFVTFWFHDIMDLRWSRIRSNSLYRSLRFRPKGPNDRKPNIIPHKPYTYIVFQRVGRRISGSGRKNYALASYTAHRRA